MLRFAFFRNLKNLLKGKFNYSTSSVHKIYRHWEVLLRSRAIETGSFILAPAQCGSHDPFGKREFCNSMIINSGEKSSQDRRSQWNLLCNNRYFTMFLYRKKIPNLANIREFKVATLNHKKG